ncbi:MAG TPA: hypothetical protein P5228_08895 [Bacteroidales bacterium]|nr:hypothetical protein [Bacteroidales bacterium]
MKAKITMMAVVAALILCVSVPAKAQFSDGKATAGINVGASLISMLFRAVDLSETGTFETSATPPVQLSFDYKVGRKFSVGAAFSFSHISADYNDPTLTPVTDTMLQNFSLTLNRISFAARGLWYYTDNDKLDLYSGLRVGLNMWPLKLSSTDPDIDVADANPFSEGLFANPVYPAFQFIVFGGTAFVTDNIGINWELCAGQPYFAAIGARYRFN